MKTFKFAVMDSSGSIVVSGIASKAEDNFVNAKYLFEGSNFGNDNLPFSVKASIETFIEIYVAMGYYCDISPCDR